MAIWCIGVSVGSKKHEITNKKEINPKKMRCSSVFFVFFVYPCISYWGKKIRALTCVFLIATSCYFWAKPILELINIHCFNFHQDFAVESLHLLGAIEMG